MNGAAIKNAANLSQGTARPGLSIRTASFVIGLFVFASAGLKAQQPYGHQYAPPSYPQQPQYAQPQISQPNDAYAGDPNTPDAMGQSTQQLAQQPTQQPLTADQLEQLLAPVALYPDGLLAQILAASTYPAQIAVADQWLRQMNAQGQGDPNQIVAGANDHTDWDPSVKALTAFPQTLDMLSQNLEWTTSLGNAYYNQPQDVMQTIQVLRGRAQQSGALQSSPVEQVTEDQGDIDLAPATPDVVYVPAYNPWTTYGEPIAPYPGFASSFFSALGGFGARYAFGGLQYGMGIGMAAFDRTPWGWLAWGLNWLTNSVLFNHTGYSTRSASVADWGFPRGGPRAHGGSGIPGDGRLQPYTRAGGFDKDRGSNYPKQVNRVPESAGNGTYRGEPRPAWGTTHPVSPAQQAYNRQPIVASARPQSDSRSYQGAQVYGRSTPAYNYDNRSYQNRSAQSYGERPGAAYAMPYQAYRAPEYHAPAYRAPQYEAPRGYASRPPASYGKSFARNENPGGQRMFGGGRESGGSSYRAPKNSYGGGHESHSFKHEKAPKMPHGGHSGGGHSGGGHSGGHHRL
jgi:hypothetical protein